MTRFVANSQLNMTTFIANADLAGLFEFGDVLTKTGSTFRIKDVEDTQEVLTLTGSFGGYNGDYPTTGTITGGSYHPGNQAGFAALSFSNSSMTVQAFTNFVNTNNIRGYFQQLLGGNDQVTGSSAADVLYGYAGNDVMNGRGGADQLRGGLGNDTYMVETRLDRVVELAGQGTDTVRSSASFTLAANVERLFLTGTATTNGAGNASANVINGNVSNNILSGLGANDVLNGGAGNDMLKGGLGNDRLTGGTGIDRFVFDSVLGSGNLDRIIDFNVKDDRILIDDDVFSAAGAVGTLAPGAFHVGSSAQDVDDRIIYNSANGRIYYDADGSGAGAQVLFAQVAPALDLTRADFLIVG